MKQVTLNYKSNELLIKEVPPPTILPGCVLVRTAFSAISLGTEGMKVTRASKGLFAMARERPDQVRQVLATLRREGPASTYRKVMNKLDAPNSLGYSLSGIVQEVGEGVTEFQIGNRVACAGEGIAAHAEMVCVPKNLCAKIPEGASLEHAAFSTIGAIAMQGVRQTPVSIGECVVVIGLGLVGQLALQVYRGAGCHVCGIDVNPEKCELAIKVGAEMAINRDDPHLEQQVMHFSGGNGVDAVLVAAATPSSDPVQLAVALCRDRGTVVVLGIVGMEFNFEKVIKKEMQIRMSRSYGPGRYDPMYELQGVDYPISYVRWTEQRNMQSFLQLIASGRVTIAPLITHKFPFAEAGAAYAKVRDRKVGQTMGILFTYDTQLPLPSRINLNPVSKRSSAAEFVVGIIGAGNFARNTLLPALKDRPGIRLRAVANASGLSARHVADRFGFEYCTADYRQLLADTDINCILIATRHDIHASLVCEALRKGKRVFVEKPLALTQEELAEVLATQRETGGQFMVGFNRRFAPATEKVKAFFDKRVEPLTVHYRVNAGFLPPDHWLQDPRLGGGRMIGEGCHFIDWMLHLIRAPIVSVSAMVMDNANVYHSDNIVAQFKFGDGSVGNLLYMANGDSRLSKERIEIFGQRSSAVVDDYQRISFYTKGQVRTHKLGAQDKGHSAEMAALVKAVLQGKEMPIGLADLIHVTKATFAVMESIALGHPVNPERMGI